MALGKQVRKYRERAGWKLETLSFKSGVEVGTINALENRDSSRSKFAPQLAKAFGLTVEQLLDEGVDYEIGTKQIATGEGEMLPADGRSAEAANVAPAQPAGLGATLANLGELLSRTSPQTRAAVADLLGRYAQDPDSSQSLAQAIELLVKADQSKKAGA